MVSLKSPQILTEILSCLSTGTIRFVQSANWMIGLIIPSATSLSNYFTIKGIIDYGNEHPLQNEGETPGRVCILALLLHGLAPLNLTHLLRFLLKLYQLPEGFLHFMLRIPYPVLFALHSSWLVWVPEVDGVECVSQLLHTPIDHVT